MFGNLYLSPQISETGWSLNEFAAAAALVFEANECRLSPSCAAINRKRVLIALGNVHSLSVFFTFRGLGVLELLLSSAFAQQTRCVCLVPFIVKGKQTKEQSCL